MRSIVFSLPLITLLTFSPPVLATPPQNNTTPPFTPIYISPDFSWDHKHFPRTSRAIPLTNILLATTAAMRFYAHLSYRESAPSIAFAEPKVRIEVLSAMGQMDNFEARHALWGLWKCALDISNSRGAREVVYGLWIRGTQIGTIKYIWQDPTARTSTVVGAPMATSLAVQVVGGTEGSVDRRRASGGDLSLRSGFEVRQQSNDEDDPWRTVLSDFGTVLKLDAVWFTIYESLVDRASKHFITITRTYEYVSEFSDIGIEYEPIAPDRATTSYQDVVSGLAHLAFAMRAQGFFGECMYNVDYDDAAVVRGRVRYLGSRSME